MYRLTVSYAHVDDDDALVSYYDQTHAPLAAKFPDLRSFSWGVCETPDGSRPPHVLIAVLEWDTRDQAMAALESEEGKAAVGDVANFAHNGVELEFQEVRQVV